MKQYSIRKELYLHAAGVRKYVIYDKRLCHIYVRLPTMNSSTEVKDADLRLATFSNI